MCCALSCGDIAIFKLCIFKKPSAKTWGTGWASGDRGKCPGNTQTKVRNKQREVIHSTAVSVTFPKLIAVVTIPEDVLSCNIPGSNLRQASFWEPD